MKSYYNNLGIYNFRFSITHKLSNRKYYQPIFWQFMKYYKEYNIGFILKEIQNHYINNFQPMSSFMKN